MPDRKYERRIRGSSATADSSPGESSAPRTRGTPDDPAATARDVCYRLLAGRDRTRTELEQALRRKEIPDEVIESVLAKFDKAGLIDDEAFAATWVRTRHANQGLGKRAIAMELRRKGVDDDVVAEAVAAVDDDAEVERAGQLVRRKLGAMRTLETQVKIRRLVAMLARRGYSEGMAYRVVRAELAADGVENTED